MTNYHIVLCFACGIKNRIPSGKSGDAKCGNCGAPLQQRSSKRTLLGRLSTWSAEPDRLFRFVLIAGFLAILGYSLLPIDFGSKKVATPTRTQTASIGRSRDGTFSVSAYVNGARVNMIVDTGASSVVLTQTAARAAGVSMNQLNYVVSVNTANGRTQAAPVILDYLNIEGVTVRSVKALVAKPGQLSTNLLGMSFLDRLESWELRGNTFTIRAR